MTSVVSSDTFEMVPFFYAGVFKTIISLLIYTSFWSPPFCSESRKCVMSTFSFTCQVLAFSDGHWNAALWISGTVINSVVCFLCILPPPVIGGQWAYHRVHLIWSVLKSDTDLYFWTSTKMSPSELSWTIQNAFFYTMRKKQSYWMRHNFSTTL